MRYRSLGRSGILLSVIGLGGNVFGESVDARGTTDVLSKALELGINFIDTADVYNEGASEELLGKALIGRRNEVVIATKTGYPTAGSRAGGGLTRRRITSQFEASLGRLRTDYIDVYYFHFPDPDTPIEESLRALDDLVRSGKLRCVACSNYPASQVVEIMRISKGMGLTAPVAVQDRYNLLRREIERELLPACAQFGLSLVPFEPLDGGFLTGKYRRGVDPSPGTRFHGSARWLPRLTDTNFDAIDQYEAFSRERGHSISELAIAWLLAQPIVCSVITGATSCNQVEANVRAADWDLEPADVSALATRPA